MSTAAEFVFVAEPRACPRCGQAGLLECSVVLDRWPTPAGEATASRRHVLCAGCDVDDAAAGPLVAFLTVHTPVGPEHAEPFDDYLAAWVDRLQAAPDPRIADAEWRTWRDGEFE